MEPSTTKSNLRVATIHRFLADRTTRPDIIFYRNGKIDITSRIAHQLHITEGTNIDICTVTYHQGQVEHYLYVRHTTHPEARCHPTHHRSHHFRCYSKHLCNEIFRLTNTQGCQRLPLLCGEPIHIPNIGTCITLITHNTNAAEY